MKYLYPLSILLLLVSCQEEEKKVIDRTKTDWAFYKLEGDVHTISEKSYEVNANNERVKTRHENASLHDSDNTFNEEGMLVTEKLWRDGIYPFEENTYNGREKAILKNQYVGDVVGVKTQYSWDKKGQNTSITRRNPDNSQIDRAEMKYKGGKLIEKIEYSAQNNPQEKVTFTYDAKGNVSMEEHYRNSEYVQFRMAYQYDEKNRKISEIRSHKDGKIIYRTMYTYEGDKITIQETFNDKGELDYSEKFSYDKNGNLVAKYTYEKNENSHTVEKSEYDANNNMTTFVATKDGVVTLKASYKYDAKKHLTGIRVADGTGKPVDNRQYTFQYDEKGNWTKKTAILMDKTKLVVDRQITYFD